MRPDSRLMNLLRFVVQHHLGVAEPHYDLMIEDGEALATWTFRSLPGEGEGPWEGRPLPPHRKAYLSCEGPVSGGRGEVKIVAAGTEMP